MLYKKFLKRRAARLVKKLEFYGWITENYERLGFIICHKNFYDNHTGYLKGCVEILISHDTRELDATIYCYNSNCTSKFPMMSVQSNRWTALLKKVKKHYLEPQDCAYAL